MENKDQRPYLLWLLARRDYSRRQLERKLKLRNVDTTEIAKLLDGLIEEGIYNPDAYKKSRTRLLLKRGLGAPAIQARLKVENCTLTQNDLDEAYQALGSSPETEITALVQKLIRRYERMKTSDKITVRQKIIKAAISKGHRASMVVGIVDQELKSKTE